MHLYAPKIIETPTPKHTGLPLALMATFTLCSLKDLLERLVMAVCNPCPVYRWWILSSNSQSWISLMIHMYGSVQQSKIVQDPSHIAFIWIQTSICLSLSISSFFIFGALFTG